MSTRIGIISDTHSRLALTQKAVTIFKNAEIAELIHCGDVGSEEIVRILSCFKTHYVSGNTDSDTLKTWTLQHGQTFYGQVGILSREEKRIAFLHGDDWRTFDDLLHRSHFDLICSGHEHLFSWRMEGETYLLNPGAFTRTAPSVAVIDLPEMLVEQFFI